MSTCLISERERYEILELYSDQSKHSNYQSMPQFVVEATGLRADIEQSWRGDHCRYAWIREQIPDLSGPTRCCDFGANTGYFSLSIANERRTCQLTSIEGNPNHAALIERVVEIIGLRNVRVRRSTIGLGDLATIGDYDVMLHLNVLHHAGADFDKGAVRGPNEFASYARRYLEALTDRTRLLIFQAGSNLWGDKTQPIVARDDDLGRFRFFADILRGAGWSIRRIAYARKAPEEPIAYASIGDAIVAALESGRDPSDHEVREALAPYRLTEHVGEFYRRALFVCSHKR